MFRVVFCMELERNSLQKVPLMLAGTVATYRPIVNSLAGLASKATETAAAVGLLSSRGTKPSKKRKAQHCHLLKPAAGAGNDASSAEQEPYDALSKDCGVDIVKSSPTHHLTA
jgi:hypothetical protein